MTENNQNKSNLTNKGKTNMPKKKNLEKLAQNLKNNLLRRKEKQISSNDSSKTD